MKKYSEIAIVYGSGGKLGKAFCDTARRDPEVLVARFTSNPSHEALYENERHCHSSFNPADNLRWLREILTLLSSNDEPRKISLIYPVGPFKFEVEDLRPMPNSDHFTLREGALRDPEIFELNVRNFKKLVSAANDAILERAERDGISVQFNMVAFGSVSDPYSPLQWHSYTESKAVLRRYMSVLCRNSKDGLVTKSGLFVRTSTIATGAENVLRPHAPQEETKYWLEPERVASVTLERLRELKPREFTELEVFNPFPGFSPAFYASSRDALVRWAKQTGRSFPGMEHLQEP